MAEAPIHRRNVHDRNIHERDGLRTQLVHTGALRAFLPIRRAFPTTAITPIRACPSACTRAPSGNGEFQVSVRGCGADDSELKPYLSMIKQTMEVRLMQSMRAEA
jgi:hypothetical protein